MSVSYLLCRRRLIISTLICLYNYAMGFLTNLFSVRLQLLQIIYDGALHFVSLYLQLKPLSFLFARLLINLF